MTARGQQDAATPAVSDLAAVVRRRRLTLGLTQADLAAATGLSLRTLRNLERGAVAARTGSLDLLERVLGPLTDGPLTDATPTGPIRAAAPGTPGGARPPLPPPVRPFVGRADELDRITDTDRGLVVVHGIAGVGKSALALEAAHRLAPGRDVVLRATLGGGSDVRDADDVLADLLVGTGVDADAVPPPGPDRRALFRRRTAAGRGLLLLDDAATEAQIRPLLPAGPRWLTLVTSRAPLGGLPSATRVPVAPLTGEEAGDLFALLTAGDHRTPDSDDGGDRDDVTRAALDVCAGLPLALRLLAGSLHRDRGGRVSALHEVASSDDEVAAAFSVSYARLRPEEQRALRWACVLAGRALETPAVAAACELDPGDAADLLDDLADAGLITPMSEPGCYEVHDLVRDYARRRSADEDAPDVVAAIRARAGRWYLDDVHATCAAYQAHPFPTEPGGRLPVPGVDAEAERVASRRLDLHRYGWWPALQDAAARGDHHLVLRAARDLYWYSDSRLHALAWHEVFGLGVAAARALGRPHEEAVHRAARGWAYGVRGDVPRALADLDAAAATFADPPSPTAQAWTAWIASQAQVDAHPARALDLALQSFAYFASADDHCHMVMTRVGIAQAQLALGDVGAAVPQLERAIAECPPNGLTGWPALIVTHSHLMLAHARLRAGRVDDAVEHARLALKHAPATDRPTSVAVATLELGITLQAAGGPDADDVLRRALTLAVDLGDRRTATRARRARQAGAAGAAA